jgi:acetate kinase
MALLKKLILVVNAGSSSIKTTLFSVSPNGSLKRLVDAHLKDLHSNKPTLDIQNKSVPFPVVKSKEKLFEKLFELTLGSHDPHHIVSIGHRIVHGGHKYRQNTLITPQFLKDFQHLLSLAPLHNAMSLAGIRSAKKYFPTTPQMAVFDTTFHQTIPDYASIYAIPYRLSTQYHLKRYGFHGISHAFLWNTYAKHTGKRQSKIITIHLGSGCSMTAIKAGKSLDTSMGFTPDEGLMMATRAGDIDSGLLEYLHRCIGLSMQKITEMLEFKSGLLGVSESSSDMRKLLQNETKNPQAKLAIEIFCYRICKYISAYLFVLGGAEAFIFSGGIGENSPEIRQRIIRGMQWYGLNLDAKKNKAIVGLASGKISLISSKKSSAAIYVIATDENLAISQMLI